MGCAGLGSDCAACLYVRLISGFFFVAESWRKESDKSMGSAAYGLGRGICTTGSLFAVLAISSRCEAISFCYFVPVLVGAHFDCMYVALAFCGSR